MVALLTGAGRGLGREITLAYAREGAKVVIAARSVGELNEVAREVSGLGGEVVAIPTDLCLESDVKRLVRHAIDHFGRVDIVVNNAGLTPGAAGGPIRSVLDVETDFWDKMFHVNCRAPFVLMREVLPSMLERRSGVLLSITSKLSKVAVAGNVPYGPSKAALDILTQIVDVEFAGYGIRANLLHPGGPVATSIFTEFYRPARGSEVREPAVIREAAVYLASDAAAGIHGQVIDASLWTSEVAQRPGGRTEAGKE
jgi:NAD(P)-dependent dehydrogenase (short-subunit alcohol dehydrogenase family)